MVCPSRFAAAALTLAGSVTSKARIRTLWSRYLASHAPMCSRELSLRSAEVLPASSSLVRRHAFPSQFFDRLLVL